MRSHGHQSHLTFDVGSATMLVVHPVAGVTQLVECDLAKVDVAGSNPVSRSIFHVSRFRSIRASPTAHATSAQFVPVTDSRRIEGLLLNRFCFSMIGVIGRVA